MTIRLAFFGTVMAGAAVSNMPLSLPETRQGRYVIMSSVFPGGSA